MVRSMTEKDCDEVLRCVRTAFTSEQHDGQEEVDIVVAIWALEASIAGCELVAVDDDEVVGHVVASLGRLDGRGIPGIAPLSVRPGYQSQGIGSALMKELLTRIDDLGFPLAVLLGNPVYYRRFWFEASGPLGLHYRPAGPDSTYFQIHRLQHYNAECTGEYIYCWEAAS
jgi:putative acetyltransferase